MGNHSDMSNDTKGPDHHPGGPGQPTDAAAGSVSGQQPTAAAATEPEGAPENGAARTEAAALRAELEETKARLDRALRAYAEADNVRKRLEREKEEAAKYAVTKLARDIVTVGDNFRRAIETAPADKMTQDTALKAFFEGIELTERELLGMLERHGVKRIDPMGEPFNPRQHQAVMEMDSPDAQAGTILQVFQAGYMIEDRILRPAMVIVSKGASKPDAPAPAPSPANDDDPVAGSRADGTTGAQEV